MRKLVSKREGSKKKRTNQLIVGLVLVGVMIISTLGFAFQGNPSGAEETNKQGIDFNGFQFVEYNNFWVTERGSFQFIFRYNPDEVIKIESEINNLDSYYNEVLYIFSEDSVAEGEIANNLGQVVKRMQKACFGEENCEEDLPVKNCEDNFIIIIEKNTSDIVQQERCVYIYGPKEDLVKTTDEFLFKIIGIE